MNKELYLAINSRKKVRIITVDGSVHEGKITDYYVDANGNAGVAIRDISKGKYAEIPETKISKVELID